MFGVSGTELVVIALIALVVVGPDRLPDHARRLGEFVRTARRQWGEIREQTTDGISRTLDETGLTDLQRDLSTLTDDATRPLGPGARP